VPATLRSPPLPRRPGRPLRSLLPLGAIAILCAATAAPCPALETAFEAGFFIDLPAGFTAAGGDGRTRWSYLDPDGRVELAVRLFEPGRFASVEAMATETLGALAAAGERSACRYEGRPALIAEISFALAGSLRRGYALFVGGQEERGYALLAHAEAARFEACGELIISCLDGFSIDRAGRRSPGPVSQFLLPWPPQRRETRTVRLPTGSLQLPWSTEEARHELYVAEREYEILKSYAQSTTLWVDAWARFYRLVYRESAARLDGLSDAIARSLAGEDPTESARRVLRWVQGFVFERDTSWLDFVPPLAAAFEARGDCDSRAMVMAIVLERLGIDCVLMLSREYSHAMLGVLVPGGGQRFPFGGRQYLVAETTAGVGLGMIDASQADFSKWLGVQLGQTEAQEPR